MALIFMGFTINCLVFDKEVFITNTMKDNQKYVYKIQKVKYYGEYDSEILNLTDEDLKKSSKKRTQH